MENGKQQAIGTRGLEKKVSLIRWGGLIADGRGPESGNAGQQNGGITSVRMFFAADLHVCPALARHERLPLTGWTITHRRCGRCGRCSGNRPPFCPDDQGLDKTVVLQSVLQDNQDRQRTAMAEMIDCKIRGSSSEPGTSGRVRILQVSSAPPPAFVLDVRSSHV